jgi:Na+-transporting NADH:ubiquinone oxidoreductase subunit C
MQRDSIANTFTVAACLCIVCSVLVSTAAVVLRPAQERNKLNEQKRNILQAAGLFRPDQDLAQLFKQVDVQVVDLETGELVDPSVIDPATYNQRAAARDPAFSQALAAGDDSAGIGRREKYSFVYLVRKDGRLSQIVLPIYGKGLWSTLYGYLALDADLDHIQGLTFYEHGETPGLGGEVDNPDWKQQWVGKRAFDDEGKIRIQVLRGQVDDDQPEAIHQVDGLAGATITARGVSNLVQFWLGKEGFGRVLENLREREGSQRTDAAS